jgi:XTP/dITP diphosphohydrolase
MLYIVIATRNPKKFRELRVLLTAPGVRWRALADFPHAPSVREDQATFRANAVKKARAVARATGCWALADDSGLEVDLLKGAPGVRSARFSGRHGNDAANNANVLRLLRGVPMHQRGARFQCVLALAAPHRLLTVSEGAWEGRIALAPVGRNGFGYEPIFWLPRRRKTSAQLSRGLKHRVSHRGQAARAMRRHLRRLLRQQGA